MTIAVVTAAAVLGVAAFLIWAFRRGVRRDAQL